VSNTVTECSRAEELGIERQPDTDTDETDYSINPGDVVSPAEAACLIDAAPAG
jgi:hypothetical protein